MIESGQRWEISLLSMPFTSCTCRKGPKTTHIRCKVYIRKEHRLTSIMFAIRQTIRIEIIPDIRFIYAGKST